MLEFLFAKVLVIHVIAVMVAVGTVTVTDYLHILGLRDPKLERRTLFVFPHLSNLIRISLLVIYLTGIIMVVARPETLQSGLFLVKLILVVLVTINGFILHHKIFPKIEHGIKNKTYPPKLLKQAAFCGSLSIVSWYGVVILSITKDLGYTPLKFSLYYLLALAIAYFTAIHIESRQRKKHSKK